MISPLDEKETLQIYNLTSSISDLLKQTSYYKSENDQLLLELSNNLQNERETFQSVYSLFNEEDQLSSKILLSFQELDVKIL